MSNESLDPLLLKLFDVASSAAWDGWLADIAAHFRSTAATLAPLHTAPNGWMGGVVVGLSPDRRNAYRDHFHRLDSWVQRLTVAEPSHPQLLSRLVPDSELLKGEFFNDYMRPAGRRYAMGVTFDCGGTRFMMCLLREAQDGDYTAEELERLQYLTGFLQRALNTQRLVHVMEAVSRASYQAMDTSRLGILLLDLLCRVLYANRIATDLLTAEDVIGVRNGRITAMQRPDEHRLRDAFEQASTQPGEQALLMLNGARSNARVTVSVARLEPPGPQVVAGFDLGVSRPTFLVMTNTLEQGEVGVDHLSAIYGLTSREANVTSLLVGGRDLDEIAKALSIGRETVRFHLKNIFAKTRTHSQRDLVLEVATTIPSMSVRRNNEPRP
ncbi:MAG: helix-turn-helix transcriptional regulator [Bauldia sp.]